MLQFIPLVSCVLDVFKATASKKHLKKIAVVVALVTAVLNHWGDIEPYLPAEAAKHVKTTLLITQDAAKRIEDAQ